MKRGRADVACMGEVLWDVFQEGGPDRFRREIGGALANVAVDLARVGVHARLVGGIGKDAFGDALAARLAGEGVDVSGLVRLPQRTGVAFVLRDDAGEPSFLFYRHATADMALEPRHVEPFMSYARWVLVGTSTLVRPKLAAATHAFLAQARRTGAGILVDLNVRPHLWASREAMIRAAARLVRGAHVVKGSAPDLAAVGGLPFLRAHAPFATWIRTDGAAPAKAWAGGQLVATEPAAQVRVIDATGAGDAFVAGLLASLVAAGAAPGSALLGDRTFLAKALQVGHKLGKMAVSDVGATTGLRDLREVRDELARLRTLRGRAS